MPEGTGCDCSPAIEMSTAVELFFEGNSVVGKNGTLTNIHVDLRDQLTEILSIIY